MTEINLVRSSSTMVMVKYHGNAVKGMNAIRSRTNYNDHTFKRLVT